MDRKSRYDNPDQVMFEPLTFNYLYTLVLILIVLNHNIASYASVQLEVCLPIHLLGVGYWVQ